MGLSRSAAQWICGAKRSLPIVLGYLPVGFAYGVLSGNAGLSDANTLLMSLVVFAGSSQFIAVGLLASGAGPAVIIGTTFIVNLRHMLMAASLAPYLSGISKPILALFSFELTDETFGLHCSDLEGLKTNIKEALALNMTAQASWVLGTIIGIFTATIMQDIGKFGVDYALAAMFIGLLVPQCTSAVRIVAAITAGILATGLSLMGMEQLFIIVATIGGATIGLGVDKWIKG